MKNLVIFTVCALSLVSCGKNAHTTKASPAPAPAASGTPTATDNKTQTTPTAATTPTDTTPPQTAAPVDLKPNDSKIADAPKADPAPAFSSVPTDQLNPNANTPIQVTPPAVNDAPTQQPAPAPSAVADCTKTETVTLGPIEARNFSDDEKKNAVLPYSPDGLPIVDMGPNTKESQTTFAFDILLPARDQVKEVTSIELILNIVKTTKDNNDTNEMICYLDSKLCSGHRYGHNEKTDKHTAMLNASFWNQPEVIGLDNQFFSDQIHASSDFQPTDSGLFELKKDAWSLDVKRLFQNEYIPHTPQDPLAYEPTATVFNNSNANADGSVAKTMHFVVAPDIAVTSAQLKVTIDKCAASGGAPAAQAAPAAPAATKTDAALPTSMDDLIKLGKTLLSATASSNPDAVSKK